LFQTDARIENIFLIIFLFSQTKVSSQREKLGIEHFEMPLCHLHAKGQVLYVQACVTLGGKGIRKHFVKKQEP